MSGTPNFPCVPQFPPGTLPISIVTIIGHISCRRPIQPMRNFLWRRSGRGLNKQHVYGFNAREISEALFGPSYSPGEFMRNHTMFSVIEPIMGNDAITEDDEHHLSEGISHYSERKWRLPSLLKLGPLLSWCPTCCLEDKLSHGFSVWKVMHQIPFIDHCLSHRKPLLRSCNSCYPRGNSGRDLRLPPPPCPECLRLSSFYSGIHRRKAYWRLIDRLASVLEVPRDSVSFHKRLETSMKFLTHRQGSDQTLDEIRTHLISEWQHDPLYGSVFHNPLEKKRARCVAIGTLIWIDVIEQMQKSNNT